ncbi:MAG: hypothetical protein ACR2PX_13270, partial [Endozoicomonas sp.]|uniref:hypothetical protein n=1 Tax=Endozoicomonas sp. TaxID=1892382 RepID=UPI003D9AD100
MGRTSIFWFFFLILSGLFLILACLGQVVSASQQKRPDFQKIENTLQDYLVEENVPWLEDFKTIFLKSSVEQPLLPSLEKLIQNYPAQTEIFETVAPLYLMLLSSDELFRSIDFFSRLRRFGIPIPDSIFAY